MIRLRRGLARGFRDERGFGLTEFLISILLFGILSTMIVSAVISFTSTFNKDRVATANTNIAAAGMNELTRVIRAATSVPVYNGDDLPAFASANNEKIILYAYIDANSATPAPVKVQFEVNATTRDLIETRWAAHPKTGAPSYWEFDNTPQSVRTIARKIVTPGTGETFMFQFYQIDDSLQPVLMTIPGSGIASSNLSKIAVVGVTMKVQTDPQGRADPVTIVNQVGIPNLGISRLGLS